MSEASVRVVAFTPEQKKADDVLNFLEPNMKLALPQFLISNKAAEFAEFILENCPRCPQRTHALNNVLLAKDAAVRASLNK